MSTKYFLGLDAGGTKTFCLIGNDAGTIRGFGRAGTGNYEAHGVAHAREQNQLAVQSALDGAGIAITALSGVGMGIAGADLPEDYEMLEKEIYTPLLGDIPRDFQNDSMAGLRGGTRQPYGIVIACGTGCVCAGRSPSGGYTRVGGLGEEFGDKTSGVSIGRQGLHSVWRARDNVLPPTTLSEKFVARSGCADTDELFYKLYRRELTESDLEPMAKLVFDAALEGDSVACDILEEHGRYLGAMVNAAARRLDMCNVAFEVVMAGSVCKGTSPVLVDAMRGTIHRECPHATPVMPVFEPVVGALIMGMELDRPLTDAVYENLTRSLSEAGRQYGVSFNAE